MPLCGGLTIGVESNEPKMPPLVIVKVPPCSSSSLSWFSRARRARSAIVVFDIGERHLVGVAQDGHDESLVGRHGYADVVVVVVDDVGVADFGVDLGNQRAGPETAALTKNDMNPSLTPCLSVKAF